MLSNERKITFPTIGRKNSEIIKDFLESLGLNIIMPPPTTDETIKKGVKYSASMVCIPLKVTLGNYIEALEKGANTLLAFDTKGTCRFRQYNKLHEFTLIGLGYEFEMVVLHNKNIIGKLAKLSGKSRFAVLRKFYQYYRKLKESENKSQTWSEEKPNIGIIGEVYCSSDEKVNFRLEEKIRKFGGNPYNTAITADFVRDNISLLGLFKLFRKDKLKKYKKEAKKYGECFGGHAYENLYNLLWLVDKGVDGVVHVLPLTCFTENTLITTKNFKSKKIKEIKKGDLVLTHKGRFKKVINTIKRDYSGEILSINCGGILKFNITPKHSIMALPKEFVKRKKKIKREPFWIEANKLNKNDFIAIPKSKGSIEKKFFKSDIKNRKTPKYADVDKFIYNKGMLRILGYYLAEGSLSYDKSKTKKVKYLTGIRFTFNKKENNFIEDIKNILQENSIECHSKVYYSKSRPNVADLSVYNRSLAYLLEKLGKKYCDKKEIHSNIMNLSPKLQLEVAKGFFRGDGCFTDKFGNTTYRAITVSFRLAEQLFWILIRNNIKCSIIEQNIKDRKKSWMIKISNAGSIKRMNDELINPTKRLNNTRFLETDDYFLIPIRKMKKGQFDGEVYNLEVEEDNSYVSNFLAVHNCMPEGTIELYVDDICKKNKIPLLRIPIDENSAEKNLETRIETFVELISLKKQKE